jgi:EAL domain-containing protein (putative c-di-GMP-specific phosphodiesterase class I)
MQLKAWELEAGANPVEPLTMNINVSGVQLAHVGFVDFIAATMEARGIRPEQINIEVTESVLMDAAGVIPIMQRLADMGIKLSIDDFGTGYSSLSYLHSLPFDTLKIDRSFVDRMGDDGKGQEIVRSIVALGRALGKSLVAEGIENETQLLMLRELHCDEGQGYYFSRPLSAEAITPMLAVWRSAMLDQQRAISCKTRTRSTRLSRGADPAGARRPSRTQQRRQVTVARG